MKRINPDEQFAKGAKNIASAQGIFEKKKFSNDITQSMLFGGMESILVAILEKGEELVMNHNLGGLIRDAKDAGILPKDLEASLDTLTRYTCSTTVKGIPDDEDIIGLIPIAQKLVDYGAEKFVTE